MTDSLGSADDEFPTGRIVAVHGSVLDIAFPAGALPAINDAIAVEADTADPIAAEVQQHTGPTTVRAVALSNTAGLRRGAKAHGTGLNVRVPVGGIVLGRLLNAVGEPVDRGPPFPATSR